MAQQVRDQRRALRVALLLTNKMQAAIIATKRILLEESERQLHSDDVALLLVAVEHRHLIAAAVDVGRLLVVDLDENEVARQHSSTLGDEADERGRAVGESAQWAGRHDERVALEIVAARPVQRHDFSHRQRRLGVVGGIGRFAPPAPGRHDGQGDGAHRDRHIAALEQETREEEDAVERRQRSPDERRRHRAPVPMPQGDRDHRDRSDH